MNQILEKIEVKSEIVSQNNSNIVDVLDQTVPYQGASDRYSLINSREILNLFLKKGFKYERMWEQKYRKHSRKGFGKHAVRIYHPELSLGHGLDKELLMQWYFWNSHDRSIRFKLVGGFWRFVCDNMMAVGTNIFEPIHILHKDLDYEFFNKQIDEALAKSVDMAKMILSLKEVQMSDEEKIEYATKMAMFRVQLSNKNAFEVINPEDLLKINREEDNNDSAWNVSNTVQENLLSLTNSINLDYKTKIITNDVEVIEKCSTRQLKSELVRQKVNLAIFPLLNEVVEKEQTLIIQQAA